MTPVIRALSLALLHFVWQGLLAYILLWGLLFAMRKRSANARYVAGCVALGVLAVLPAVTMFALYARPIPATGVTLAAAPVQIASPALRQSTNWLMFLQVWAVPTWCAGVVLFSLRLVYGSTQLAVVRKRGESAEQGLLSTIAMLAARMGVKQRFGVLISKVADGPGVAGILRPVMLLPAATVVGLSPEQLEAVLAHELAHIRRYDYLVNIAQMLVEALLFYHPAVWWISAHIRRERELCCDDEAVRTCDDSLCYARALAALERLRMTAPGMVLGVTDGPLAYRVKRLLGVAVEETLPSKLPALVALCLAMACLGVSINLVHGQANADAPGIRVDLGSSAVIHRTSIEYPTEAQTKGVQGTVQVEVHLDEKGNVSDARVLSGPDEFRKTVLQSVLGWHFPPESAGTTKVVNVEFQTPAQRQPAATNRDDAGTRRDIEATVQFLQEEARQLEENVQQAQTQLGQNQDAIQAREAEIRARKAQLDALQAKLAAAQTAQRLAKVGPIPKVFEGRIVRGIQVEGLGISLSDFLLQAQLPIREGDTLTQSLGEATITAVKEFDEHLNVLWMADLNSPNGVQITITAPGASANSGSDRGRSGAGIGGGAGGGIGGGVGGGLSPDAVNSTETGVTAPVVIDQTQPEYTEEARKAKWQGTVLLRILVDETGKLVEERVVKSLGMGLDQKAMLAVWQWRFKPGTKDGKPVPVHANIEVNFRLP